MSSNGCARAIASLLLLAGGVADAAVFCVDSVEQLREALLDASDNGQDDTIQVQVGSYYIDAPLDYGSGEAKNLTLVGGYGAPMGGGVCLRLNPDPAATAIDGQGLAPVLRILPGGQQGGDVTLRGVTLRNGVGTSTYDAVHLGGSAGWSGTLTIEANRFERLTGYGSNRRAVNLSADQGRLIVRNNVFVDNVGGADNASPISFLTNSANQAWVHHNTVTGNAAPGGHPASIGGLSFSGVGTWSLGNNIIAGNAGRDMHATASMLLRHNVISVLSGSPAIGSVGNQAVDPQFLAADDLRLTSGSPLVDAGYAVPEGGIGDRDAWGGERLAMSAPDIGAYEWQDVLFADGFE